MAKDRNEPIPEEAAEESAEENSSKRDRRKKSKRKKRDESSNTSSSSSEESSTGSEDERPPSSRKRKRHRSSRRRRRRSSSSDSESDTDLESDAGESESEGEGEETKRRSRSRSREKEERRRRREKRRKREKEERRRRRRKKEKEKERKSRRRKKEKEGGKKGAVTNSWGKYGIIRETDMWNKRPEFTAWLAEVKQVNLETLPNWEEKQMFKEFMEDHNTATFPSKKYYDLDAYHRHKMEKELKKGLKKVSNTERTIFDDEEQRRIELQRERERHKEEQVEALKSSMQGGMAQAMKEQARLKEEMAYQYRLGNFEAAAAIQRRLDPDVAM